MPAMQRLKAATDRNPRHRRSTDLSTAQHDAADDHLPVYERSEISPGVSVPVFVC